jgi:DNA mismatch repair protein MutL
MAFPEIFFSLQSNGQEVFHLEKGNLKQRILQVLGNNYNAKLVNVNEQTDYLNITGFVGKPEAAKKTRGDQYLFVNNRFIKSAYLNHAIMNAFSDMIPKDSFPMYALFIDLDPAQLDINVHPTKQEIKFEDDKIVYAFVQATVKHALAQFSITPTLDFELDAGIQQLDSINKPMTDEQRSNTANASSLFKTFSQKNQAHLAERSGDLKHWKDFYESPSTTTANPSVEKLHKEYEADQPLIQLHNSYVVMQKHNGFLVIHQQNAHERILYEKYTHAVAGKPIATQQSLFPTTIELSMSDAIELQELLPDMKELGYQIEHFGQQTFVIQGTPADVDAGNEKMVIEKMLEEYKYFSSDVKFSKREKLIRSMASQHAIKAGVSLSQKEMQQLTGDLFSCEVANTSPNGKPTYMSFYKEEMDKLFGR